MSRKRPYYPIHKIQTGKYTKGGEYVLEDGTEYIGPYHILPNSWVYSGFVPHKNSIDLYDIHKIIHSDPKYIELTNIKTGNYLSPKYYIPIPTPEDYNNGFFERFFVQKRTNPINTIIEINMDQYTSINQINGPGINSNIWRGSKFKWMIRGETNSIISTNNLTLQLTERIFPGINKHIKNLIEYAKF